MTKRTEMQRWAAISAMRISQNEYRQHGIPPGDGWDRGTHFARFEAMGRLHWAIRRYRIFKPAAVLVASYEIVRLRHEIQMAADAVRRAACPILPG